jgi:hypothetical protein
MIRPNENPLFPASLAANGRQGAKAKADGPCEAQDSAQAMAAHYLARMAVDAARGQLDRYALATDDPAPGVIDAADLLDAAAACLATAEFSDAIKGARGGES